MSELPRKDRSVRPTQKADSSEDVHLEEEEKLVDGRKDVDYPALLTRDVKGG